MKPTIIDKLTPAQRQRRPQETFRLELVARVDLCEHDGATAADRKALAELTDRRSEAADTNAVAKARALLRNSKRA